VLTSFHSNALYSGLSQSSSIVNSIISTVDSICWIIRANWVSTSSKIFCFGSDSNVRNGTTEELLTVFAECKQYNKYTTIWLLPKWFNYSIIGLKKADSKLDPSSDLLGKSTVNKEEDHFAEALAVFERLNPKEYAERYQTINKTVATMVDLYAFVQKTEQVERLYKRQMELATKCKLIDIDFEEMFEIVTRYAQFCVFQEDWKTAHKILSQKVDFVKHLERQQTVPQLVINLYAEAYNQLVIECNLITKLINHWFLLGIHWNVPRQSQKCD